MNALRLLRTVRYLKFRQILNRFSRLITLRRFRDVEDFERRSKACEWTMPVPKQVSMTGPRQFNILNLTMSIDSCGDWNSPDIDKLGLYNLHYMDDLNAVGASERAAWHRDLIDHWMDSNPVLHGNGWEAYTVSLRIVNWIKWELAGGPLSERAHFSLYLQARVLFRKIEYHLQGNHLFANAKALVFVGAFFTGPEADAWLRKGLKLLGREMYEQILADGGHIERSPMYHSIILEDVLDIVNLCRCFEIDFPDSVESAVFPMFGWLRMMTHPDGTLARFNDTISGVASKYGPLLEYAQRLGFVPGEHEYSGLQIRRDSGYVRFDRGPAAMIADVGEVGPDYQPGHAHCDCLSFELSIGKERQLVNAGISTYKVCERRLRERQTVSHNTVSVEGVEQSEVWSAFRVGRRARPVDIDIGEHHVSAGHDGYQTVGVIHRRSFCFHESGILIKDRLQSDAPIRGTAHFHFRPHVDPVIIKQAVRAGPIEIVFPEDAVLQLRDYSYCREFNRVEDAKELLVVFCNELDSRISYEDSIHIG